MNSSEPQPSFKGIAKEAVPFFLWDFFFYLRIDDHVMKCSRSHIRSGLKAGMFVKQYPVIYFFVDLLNLSEQRDQIGSD